MVPLVKKNDYQVPGQQ